MTEQKRKPGIRVVDGKRRDMDKDRVKGRMSALPEHAPTAEQAAARRKSLADRERREKKAAANGSDGTKLSRVKVKLSADRSGQHVMRSRPGTFEWRYGRKKQDALFLAGNHLAILWERAGMTIASSANFLRGVASGYATGLAEGRAQALDRLDGFRETMGQKPTERLIDYCVLGLTTAEIARKNGAKERDMAPVLHQHLRDCAVHFKFVTGNRV